MYSRTFFPRSEGKRGGGEHNQIRLHRYTLFVSVLGFPSGRNAYIAIAAAQQKRQKKAKETLSLIIPTFFPPLLPEIAIELGLTKLLIYSVVSIAHPSAQLLSRIYSGRVFPYVFLEILSTPKTWVYTGEYV